jgi:hypothetical protein
MDLKLAKLQILNLWGTKMAPVAEMNDQGNSGGGTLPSRRMTSSTRGRAAMKGRAAAAGMA